jgi:hypothetical protein
VEEAFKDIPDLKASCHTLEVAAAQAASICNVTPAFSFLISL